MSSPRNSTAPAVGGNRPQIRLTIVLFPEPFGPISPKIRPGSTLRSTPSTARTPPKCLLSPLSASTDCFSPPREEPLEPHDGGGIEKPPRAHVHRQHDQAAEEQVAPVPHEAQPLDQEALDEDHGDEGPEDVREPAEDRIGDGEGREHD